MKTKALQSDPAFSLLEFLVGITVVALLAAFLLPVFNSLSRRAEAAACLNRLRHISSIFHAYAADHQNRVRFLRDGSGLMWFDALQKQAGIDLNDAKKAFGCPSRPWKDNGAWVCYGMRLGYLTTPANQDPGFPIQRFAEGENALFHGGTYGFSIPAVTEPSKFLLMADSAYTTGKQTHRLAGRALYSNGGICLRHQGWANVLFLDGHVEALNTEGVFKQGFTQALDDQGNVLVP